MKKYEIINLEDNRNIYRKNFSCLKCVIDTKSEFLKSVKEKATIIEKKLNKKQANTSKYRDEKIIKIDNFAGLLAEKICEIVLKKLFGLNVIKDNAVNEEQSKNQVDLRLFNDKTIEVRSSFVRNGIGFAIFKFNKRKKNEQYFDVIGPYSNGYKPGEMPKDYYMRVFYEGEKEGFLNCFSDNYITVYITGGATKDMMYDENINQIKYLIPEGINVETKSNYVVIPMIKSLDFMEFIEVIEKENNIKRK